MIPKMAMVVPVLIALASAPVLPAQSVPAKNWVFEVVSIKLNSTADPRSGYSMKMEPDGRLTIRGIPVYMLIAASYGVAFQSPRLSGGADWTRSERYDIDAVAEKGAITAELPPQERDERTRQMVRSMLADRFKLKMRHEEKEVPVYALVRGKGEPKLQKSQTQEQDCSEKVPCHKFTGGQGRGIHGKAVTIPDVAQFVENWTDRPMVDRTAIQGLFDIDTDGWIPMRPRQGPPRDPSTPPSAEELANNDPATPTLFNIFDRLGLKMEPQRAPVAAYAIESVERPTAN